MSARRTLPSPALLARLVRRLAPHLRRQRGRFGLAFLGTLGVIAGELLEPWPLKVVVDHALEGRPSEWLPVALSGPENRDRLLLAAAIALVVFAILRGLCAFVRELFGAAAGQRVVMAVREDVHAHVQRLSTDFHLAARHGDLLLRLTGDLTLVRELLVDALLEIARHALLLAGMGVVLVALSPALGLVALLVVPVLVVLQRIFHGRIVRAAAKQRENEAKLAAHAGEMLAAMDLVHAYQLEGHLAERFHARNRKSLKSGLAGTRLKARLAGSLEIALALGVAATLFLGARAVAAHDLTTGDLLVLLSYVRGTYKPLRQISQRSARVAKAAGAATRLLELLEIEPAVIEKPDARPLDPAAPLTLAFERAGLEHGNGAAALREISLSFEPGRRVLVLGRNGAGKSSLLSLVPRLRDPTGGLVRLGGTDLRDLKLAALRETIGWLPQEPALFEGTIEENLRLGRIDAAPAEIAHAARLAGLPAAFPDEGGLDAILKRRCGERGRRLSGGQRLRVALARLLLRRPRIVLLDEPEAALDAPSRGALLRDLFAALPGATAIVVAHTVDAPELFDEVVVLEAGRVLKRGSAAEIGRIREELVRSGVLEEAPS